MKDDKMFCPEECPKFEFERDETFTKKPVCNYLDKEDVYVALDLNTAKLGVVKNDGVLVGRPIVESHRLCQFKNTLLSIHDIVKCVKNEVS